MSQRVLHKWNALCLRWNSEIRISNETKLIEKKIEEMKLVSFICRVI